MTVSPMMSAKDLNKIQTAPSQSQTRFGMVFCQRCCPETEWPTPTRGTTRHNRASKSKLSGVVDSLLSSNLASGVSFKSQWLSLVAATPCQLARGPGYGYLQ